MWPVRVLELLNLENFVQKVVNGYSVGSRGIVVGGFPR